MKNFSLEPIEQTTHDLYFHENSPVISIDNYNNIFASCGYDNVIRIWEIEKKSDVDLKLNDDLKTSNNSKISEVDLKQNEDCIKISNDPKTANSDILNSKTANSDILNSKTANFDILNSKTANADILNSRKFSKNSSIKIKFLKEFEGFKSIINCVRFNKFHSKNTFLAACADQGTVILYYNDISYKIRNSDEDNAYDLCWVSEERIIIAFGSGNIEIYDIFFDQNKIKSKLALKESIHSGVIQGITFFPYSMNTNSKKKNSMNTNSKNKNHGLFATHSLDGSVKAFLIPTDSEKIDNKNKKSIDNKNNNKNVDYNKSINNGFNNFFVIDQIININKEVDTTMAVYRRLLIDNNELFVISKEKSITVFDVFLSKKIKKIGPFDSSVIKILKLESYLIVVTKRSIYIMKDDCLIVGIQNAAFKELTDAFIYDSIIFYSSMDGMIGSVRCTFE